MLTLKGGPDNRTRRLGGSEMGTFEVVTLGPKRREAKAEMSEKGMGPKLIQKSGSINTTGPS